MIQKSPHKVDHLIKFEDCIRLHLFIRIVGESKCTVCLHEHYNVTLCSKTKLNNILLYEHLPYICLGNPLDLIVLRLICEPL